MNQYQQFAYDNACGRVEEIGDEFFHQYDNRIVLGLTVNR